MSLSEVQIDREALVGNLRKLKHLAPPCALACVVVKGNAYGHGLAQVIESLCAEADCFQVDDFFELESLRKVTAKRALVLGYMTPEETAEAIRLGCELAAFDLDHLRTIDEIARGLKIRVKVHLKVDALLGRLGVLPSEFDKLLAEIGNFPQIHLQAIYAHFANIEDTTDLTHAEAQRSQFAEVEALLASRGIVAPSHISATSGLMTLEASRPRSMVRLGIGVYGMYPSGPLARTRSSIDLRPALRWVSRLAQVKDLPAKHPVGYGLTYVTSKPTRIGIVPQGYSDGYDRGLSNSGEVLIGGARCPVIGRVAMNMFAVDLSPCPYARRDDEVVLIGRQGSEDLLAEELATRLGTINYEVTARISPLLPRKLV
jgi:alanine racemase